jgi:thiosulfate dehydrogenase
MMRRERAGLLCALSLMAGGVVTAGADAPPPRPRPKSAGAESFSQQCAVCHLADGTGAEGMVPSIKGSPVPSGEPATFVKLLVKGPASVLPPERMRYENDMPSFEALSDDELAGIINYVRQTFGQGGARVTAAQVKAARQ